MSGSPAVSGVPAAVSGAPAAVSGPLVALRADPLSVDEAIAHVRHAGAGAVCVFLGDVRDHNDGRAVVRLEYEAYASMALAEMGRIAAEIAAETPGLRLALLHRTGSLAVGDTAVVCAASAPHRGEAYAACRALIDRVKARVPIWKREHGPEGAYWVGWQDARCGDGEEGHAHGATHGDAHDHGHARHGDAHARAHDGTHRDAHTNDSSHADHAHAYDHGHGPTDVAAPASPPAPAAAPTPTSAPAHGEPTRGPRER